MNKRERETTTDAFSRIRHKTAYLGSHVEVSVDTFSYADGREGVREIVEAPEVVVVCAFDEEGVWLVGQPREAAGLAECWELPAGGVDARDEDADDPVTAAAARELSEEVGVGAQSWELARTFYSSPGITSERMHLLMATGLGADSSGHADEDERLSVRKLPFSELDAFLAECVDAKTVIGLSDLRRRLNTAGDTSILSPGQQDRVLDVARRSLAKTFNASMDLSNRDQQLAAARFAGQVCAQLDADLAATWPREEPDGPPRIERKLLVGLGARFEEVADLTVPEAALRALFEPHQHLLGGMREWGVSDTDLREQADSVLARELIGKPWPTYRDKVDIDEFLFELRSAALTRGWKAAEDGAGWRAELRKQPA